MKVVTVRVDRESAEMLFELNDKHTTAAQTVIHLFTYLRRVTIMELRGRFNPLEIKAMAEVYKWFKPAWRIMCDNSAIITTIVNEEKHKALLSAGGVNIDILVKKLEALNSAQATILQLELINFWEHETPDIKTLIKELS